MTTVVEIIVTGALSGIVVALVIARLGSQKQLIEANNKLIESYRSFDQLLDRLSQAVDLVKPSLRPAVHPWPEHWIPFNADRIRSQVRANRVKLMICASHAVHRVQHEEYWRPGNLAPLDRAIQPIATTPIRAGHELVSLAYWDYEDTISVDEWAYNDAFMIEKAEAFRPKSAV